jgi:hypothetical protein
VAVEAKGGPYLVYRETGTVVRLGTEPKTIPAGPPLGEPVVTPDGTLWLQRTDTNVLCRLRPDADVLSCSAAAPRGHAGALTVVGDRAVFVDTESDTLSPVTADGLGRPADAGVDLPADAGIAAADVQGRLAVLDPQQRRMHLVDASTVGSERPASAPVSVDLPAGTYATPSAGRSSVVLLDQEHRTLLTYDRDGRRQGVTEVPPETGESRLSRGQDDRVYVEGGEGKHVLVVDDRGRARAVPPAGAGTGPSSRAPQPPPGEPTTPPATTPAQPGPRSPLPAGGADTADDQPTGANPPRRTPGSTATGNAPQTRKAVPASPPGMPPQARARVSGGTIVVSWGAAAANGASVSGYRVSWAPASGGASKTVNRSGGSRSASLTGITKGVAYRITVAAENSAGRGPAATVRATVPKPAPSRTLTVSRGETTTHEPDCLPPECAYIQVAMRGFKPNTDYDITPYSSAHGNFNPGARLTTNSEGNLTARHRFPYNGIGDRVWVVVDGQTSNRLLWTLE